MCVWRRSHVAFIQLHGVCVCGLRELSYFDSLIVQKCIVERVCVCVARRLERRVVCFCVFFKWLSPPVIVCARLSARNVRFFSFRSLGGCCVIADLYMWTLFALAIIIQRLLSPAIYVASRIGLYLLFLRKIVWEILVDVVCNTFFFSYLSVL